MSSDPVEEHCIKVTRGVRVLSGRMMAGAVRASRSMLTRPMKEMCDLPSRRIIAHLLLFGMLGQLEKQRAPTWRESTLVKDLHM